ncbi:MAG: YcxB family protein [Prolixibacteraceae bacterium]|nr:YcxB family protein [Prolixibacteraceae bacterium]
MRIEFTLKKDDFLTFQLFAASKSERIIKSRKNSRIRLPIVYFLLGLLLFVYADLVFALAFIGVGIIWYLLHPIFMKTRYIKHFKKYIDETYKNRFGKPVTLMFDGDYIITTDYLSDSKLKINEITEINEIKEYIYLMFSSGETLILPKERIGNLNELNNLLTSIASRLNINHTIDLNWQWK